MDKMIIENLKIFCHHGVYDAEKENGQNFYVSLTAYFDTSIPGTSDNIDESVNYADLCHKIDWFMKDNRFNLIEAVAEKLAEYILLNFTKIKRIILKISKPEAPIGLPFGNVSIEVDRGWRTAYIAVGSNMGDSLAIINKAINKFNVDPKIRLLKTSDIIKTEPYGMVEQDDFLNGAIEIETLYNPYELLGFVNMLENEAGRVRDIHWGPRTLDLDIILYDREIINDEKLVIPHIDMQNRIFVLEPLCQIAPYAYNPKARKTIYEMYNDIKEN